MTGTDRFLYYPCPKDFSNFESFFRDYPVFPFGENPPDNPADKFFNMEFDEQKAVEHINRRLTEAGRTAYPEDEVLNVVDMIWDFYEENGLLDVDAADDDIDEDIEPDMIDYVTRMLRKDKSAVIDAADVPLMVRAEVEYEDSVL